MHTNTKPNYPTPFAGFPSHGRPGARGDTRIDVAINTLPPYRPRPQATALPVRRPEPTIPSTPVDYHSSEPRRHCSASLKIALLSGVGALGSCGVLAHSIIRTLDNPNGITTANDCQGAVECGSADSGNLVLEYVGAAVLGLTAAFGAGAAWMIRDNNN